MISLYVIGLLSCGSLSTLISKYQFSTYGVGSEGYLKPFDKPGFTTLCMFIGMSLVFTLRGLIGVSTDTKPHALLSERSDEQSMTLRDSLLILIPTGLDLIASWLCLYGLTSTCASVWQILRGSLLIFTAIFSVTILNQRISKRQWLGIVICVIAIIIVGLADASNKISRPSSIIGISAVIASQVFQALQVVLEEKFIKSRRICPSVHPGESYFVSVSVFLWLTNFQVMTLARLRTRPTQ